MEPVALPLVALDQVLFPGGFVTLPVEGVNAPALEASGGAGAQVFVGEAATKGAIGTTAQVTLTPDGRRAVLTGLRRSRVSGVAQQAPYVTVTLEAYDEPPSSEQLAPLAQQVLNRYLTTVEPHLTGTTWLQHLAIPDDVVNFVAGRAGFTCREERALLELPNAEARAWVLLQRLEGARKRQPKRGAHLALAVGLTLCALAAGAVWFLR
jgi:Lon protease-like protein